MYIENYENDDVYENFIYEVIETTLELMDDFITENPTLIHYPNFNEIFESSIYDNMILCLKEIPDDDDVGYSVKYENTICNDEITTPNQYVEEYDEWIFKFCCDIFYIYYPEREKQLIDNIDGYVNNFFHFDDDTDEVNIKQLQRIEGQIYILQNINKTLPQQRTKEWYEVRYNLITASDAYKVFEKTQTQFIVDKTETPQDGQSSKKISASSLSWGQKYEPVSVMIYEDLFKTKTEEFGCIRHSKYDFLGASPDGINTLKSSPHYGTMLEIKNPISREITGFPKKEYWVQCQLQLECCNLDNCHFLETKFKEYETFEDFLMDKCDYDDNDNHDNTKSNDFLYTKNENRKGIIIHFSKNGENYYSYKPLNMKFQEYENWVSQEIDNNIEKTFINIICWKLEVFSCVLIKRNEKWFQDNINTFITFWDLIKTKRLNLIDEPNAIIQEEIIQQPKYAKKEKDKDKDKDKKGIIIKFDF